MTNSATQAKFKFLNAAALEYAILAPGTSSHLMQVHNTEAVVTGLSVSDNKAISSCKACGTVLMPTQTSRKTVFRADLTKERSSKARPKRPRSKRSPPKLNGVKIVKVECLKCHRFEETQLKPPPAVKFRGGAADKVSNSAHEKVVTASRAAMQSQKPVNTNASSKQRAKARKQSSLQAMLEKSKASTTGPSQGFGLGLLDLMTEG